MAPKLSDSELASLRAVVNAIPDMVIRIGGDHVFRSFEGNVEDLFWPADVYLGMRVEEVLPEAAAARFAASLEKALASGHVQHLQYSLSLEGAARHYESRMVKISDEEVIAIVRNVTAGIIDTLMDYPWPGNVRELQNVLYRFVPLKRLDLTGGARPVEAAVENDGGKSAPLTPLSEAVADFEKRQITAALAECRWNRTRTAKALGIGLRTLQRKMKILDIS